MELQSSTWAVLSRVWSVHKHDGFHTVTQIRTYWEKYGPRGFLNIKEITPGIVREIRTKIIN